MHEVEQVRTKQIRECAMINRHITKYMQNLLSESQLGNLFRQKT